MRNKNLSVMLAVMALILSLQASAQESTAEMADLMRSNGKIFVVVAVLSTILAGLILYLVSLDKRIRRIERESE